MKGFIKVTPLRLIKDDFGNPLRDDERPPVYLCPKDITEIHGNPYEPYHCRVIMRNGNIYRTKESEAAIEKMLAEALA
jgi:hypothetical protein